MPLRPFRFGVINQSFSTAAAWREQAKKAEAIGCSTFLIRDHLVSDHFGIQFAPFTALAIAAAATNNIHVGTYMIDNDFRHPAVLAKECATLDLLSDRRFELGLGAGWLKSEYDRAGISFDPAGIRLSRMEESIKILKGLLAGEAVTVKGDHYDVHALQNFPTPTAGRIPLVIGGGKKRVLQIAGREADTVGVMTSTLTTTFSSTADPDERRTAAVEARLGWIKEGAGMRFDQIELCTGADMIVTDAKASHVEQLIDTNGWSGLTASDIADMPLIQIGSLDAIADGLHEIRERFGFSYFVIDDSEMDDLAPLIAHLANA